ncbi:tyrosine-type recombinase/integrase [Streptomyces sp. NBC_00154]|uniref:tyrosine-type recombinase/integrase n=1 Tax=Streptomyces sp. NBC_00154 TaxID=2975670 RepID=UPI00224EB47C|nr:tyrosine-type recombinase/integrase [Streptomyces sp. NBC_00154]MCX5316222.1 tyrosine-type recombinase/integrase [Streptomyces sp. NBC_00154]
MVDDELGVVEEADRFLRELRLARGRAETTTKAYAEAVVLFLTWCANSRREWRTAARDMGLFMLWLKWTPGNGGQRRVVVPGPGAKPVRGESRINKVLTAVRMFLVHAVVNKAAPTWVLEQIYELGDDRDLPQEARGESGAMRYRMRARHPLQEPATTIDRAGDEEIVAMFLKCRSARDRLILLLLVNLFRPPYGAPMTTDAIGELCESLSRRAGLGRKIGPRMCRHAMASNVADAGGKLDEVQALLGQKSAESPRPYLHPKPSRLREAVERVPLPRVSAKEGDR